MDEEIIINKILKDNLLVFLKNAKEDCQDKNYYDKICKLISYYENKNKNVKKINTYESDINKRLSIIDNFAYKKSWNKLNKQQRLIKLNNFLNNFIKEDALNSVIIKEKILNDFENNKLNCNNLVNYDSLKCKINSITNLNYDIKNKKYIY